MTPLTPSIRLAMVAVSILLSWPRPTRADVVVRPGDTLWQIAEQAYGNRHFARLLAHLNRLEAQHLEVGTTIATPPPRVLLKRLIRSRSLRRYGDQVLAVRQALLPLAAPINAHQSPSDVRRLKKPLPLALKAHVLGLEHKLVKIGAASHKDPWLRRQPSFGRQLHAAAMELQCIARNAINQYSVDLAEQHLINALWALHLADEKGEKGSRR